MKTPALIAHEVVEKHVGDQAGGMAEIIMKMVEEAIERSRSECPVPGAPLTDDRFRQIETLWRNAPNPGGSELHRQFGELINHIRYLYHIMNGPEAEATYEAYQAGYKNGFDAGKEEGVKEGYEQVNFMIKAE